MSMSQEEIESLMNGLDITENENSKDEEVAEDNENSESMSEEDIESLIAQTNISTSSNDENEEVDNDSIDDLLKELEEKETSSDDTLNDESIDDLLNSLENNNEENENEMSDLDIEKDMEDLSIEADEEIDTSEIDELLEGLKNDNTKDDYLKELDDLNIGDEAKTLEELEYKEEDKEILKDESFNKFDDVVSIDKINIPNQLGEVANDSEEKATKIFDALSYILEDNASLRKTVKGLDSFIQSQQKMLETLNAKFPKIKEFSDNLELVNSLADMPTDIQTRLSNRDKELYEAMELMQFHDINRQKIERVMKVVVNLSKQLNDIFEDSAGSTSQIPVSKHLPGDKSLDIVGNDDLESLIAEFGK